MGRRRAPARRYAPRRRAARHPGRRPPDREASPHRRVAARWLPRSSAQQPGHRRAPTPSLHAPRASSSRSPRAARRRPPGSVRELATLAPAPPAAPSPRRPPLEPCPRSARPPPGCLRPPASGWLRQASTSSTMDAASRPARVHLARLARVRHPRDSPADERRIRREDRRPEEEGQRLAGALNAREGPPVRRPEPEEAIPFRQLAEHLEPARGARDGLVEELEMRRMPGPQGRRRRSLLECEAVILLRQSPRGGGRVVLVGRVYSRCTRPAGRDALDAWWPAEASIRTFFLGRRSFETGRLRAHRDRRTLHRGERAFDRDRSASGPGVRVIDRERILFHRERLDFLRGDLFFSRGERLFVRCELLDRRDERVGRRGESIDRLDDRTVDLGRKDLRSRCLDGSPRRKFLRSRSKSLTALSICLSSRSPVLRSRSDGLAPR